MIKKLFSHSAIYGLAPQITSVASFLSLPLITTHLTSIDFGVSGVLTAYTSAVSVFSTLGLRLVLVNSYFKMPSQYKWLWRQIYGFLSIWNLFYALLLSILIYLVIPSEAIQNKWIIIFLNVLPLVFFSQTITICSTYYQLKQEPLQVALRSGLFGLLTVALNVYFIVYLKMGYMGWFWSNFISGILNNLSYFLPLNFILGFSPIFNFKWRLIKNSLKTSIPIIPHYYSSYLLNNSDKALMKVLSIDLVSIGRYNFAYMAGLFMNSIGMASGMAVSPILNQYYKNKDDESAKNLVFILQISFLIFSFIISIWLKEIFQFSISNQELANTYNLGIVIVMAYSYRPMYFGSVNKFFYMELTGLIWKITLTAGLLNVILNLLLIPFFGFEIAALNTFIAYVYMGYAGFFSKQFKKINTAKYYPEFWIICKVFFLLLAYVIVELNYSIKIGISAFLVIIGYCAIKRIDILMKR